MTLIFTCKPSCPHNCTLTLTLTHATTPLSSHTHTHHSQSLNHTHTSSHTQAHPHTHIPSTYSHIHPHTHTHPHTPLPLQHTHPHTHTHIHPLQLTHPHIHPPISTPHSSSYPHTCTGDWVWQCRWWEQAGVPPVPADQPHPHWVDLQGKPSLCLLHLLHVCQHCHAQQIEKVSARKRVFFSVEERNWLWYSQD